MSGRPTKSRAHFRALQCVYDFVYTMILVAAWPVLLYRLLTSPRHRAGLMQRLGNLPGWPNRGPRIWIHGVSVGEVLAAKSLIEVLERELPDHEIVISTTTKSGHEVARNHYRGKRVFYYPLDFSFATRRVLASVRPQVVILMELEIWPNFLLSTSNTQVPVLLVNGRISARSYRDYRFLQRVIPEPMDRILLYCVQTRTYADRFLELGVQADRVRITGTMKFDNIPTEGVEDVRRRMFGALGLKERERVLMAGSTHHSEEEVLLSIFADLVAELPDFRLVIAPRHPERIAEVEALIHRHGRNVVRKTRIGEHSDVSAAPVIVVDTMGELASLYAAADLVFVGGSLVSHGGQNMMEPAGLGRAVLFGPHIQNFQESVDILLDAEAAVLAEDPQMLRKEIFRLARDPDSAAEMGRRARQVVIEHKGASGRIMKLIRPFLEEAPAKGTGR